jgi:hypothetical protein
VSSRWLTSIAWLVCVVACRSAQGVASDQRVDPTHEPKQAAVEPPENTFEVSVADTRWSITPLARYEIAARVLGAERYFLGEQSRLSPLDLALGWGPMANPEVDRFISWYQSGRWYFYRWSGDSPYRTEDISPASANVHMVPATTNVRRALLELSTDDIVWLQGALISVRSIDNLEADAWRSSLSRTDQGDGACELMWVERLVAHGVEYH